MGDLTLRQLELMAELPHHSTLADAAAALHISESGLSQAVSEVERVVGEQLCVRRRSKGLQMTPSGQHFARRARQLVDDVASLVDDLAGAHGQVTGPIRVGCYVGISATVLPPVLEYFDRVHPGVTIDVEVGGDNDLLPQLADGRIDFAILYDISLPSDLNKRTVYATEVVAVLPPDHPAAAADSVDLVDLAALPLIVLDTAPSTAYTHRMFAEHGVRPRIRTSVPTIELARALVGRGMGYSLLMWRPFAPAVGPEGAQLITRPLRPRAGRTNVVAAWPQHLRLSSRAELFLDTLLATMSETSPWDAN